MWWFSWKKLPPCNLHKEEHCRAAKRIGAASAWCQQQWGRQTLLWGSCMGDPGAQNEDLGNTAYQERFKSTYLFQIWKRGRVPFQTQEKINKREQKSGRWMQQLMERKKEETFGTTTCCLAANERLGGRAAHRAQPGNLGLWVELRAARAVLATSRTSQQQQWAKGPLQVPSNHTLVCVNEHWPTSLSAEQTPQVLLVTFILWFYILLVSSICSLIIKLLNDKQCFTLSKGHIWRKSFLQQHVSWVTWQHPSSAWKILLQNVRQSWKLEQTLESKLSKCLACPKTAFQHSNLCIALYITDLRVSWREDSICAFQHRDCIFTASC